MSDFISNKEIRAIVKNNNRIIKDINKRYKEYEKNKAYFTEMNDENNVVEFEDLHTYFYTDNGIVKAVNGVTFNVPKESIVGVVGESGCGKSVTSMSLMRLVQAPQGQISGGSIRFKTKVEKLDEKKNPIPLLEEVEDENGNKIMVQKANSYGAPLYEMEEVVYDIAKLPIEEMRKIRGRDITMIFQEPMTSLNPVFTIGNQLDEVSILHNHASKAAAKRRSLEMIELVGISDPKSVYKRYPHELSGGMRQRIMIAMALAANPKLIIADEPTTALDVTIQAQILELLREVQKKSKASVILITHDLGVIAEMADYVVVMYAGKVIEQGTALEIFENPMHPYTIGLQRSKPRIDGNKDEPLFSIPGNVPNPINMPSNCYFKNRCSHACEKCNGEYPKMIQVSPTHFVSCYRATENLAKIDVKKGGK